MAVPSCELVADRFLETSMIYPEISLDEWLSKYKGLKIAKANCNSCGEIMESSIPFISSEYIGLTSPKCKCGISFTRVESALPRTKEEQDYWNSL